MSTHIKSISDDRPALVVCDMQPDLLGSIPAQARKALIIALKICIAIARRSNWSVIFTGLRFPPGYKGLDPRHRLFGGLKRLNAKMGNASAHWFLEGYAGAEIEPSLVQKGDTIVWRQGHLPGAELLDVFKSHGITKAFVTGIKAGYSVQATCQALCDAGIQVAAVRECVQDDKKVRFAAVLEHLLPIYADVISLKDLMIDTFGASHFVERADPQSLPTLRRILSVTDAPSQVTATSSLQDERYCSDCGRTGHGALFFRLLLERPNWIEFPTQSWYSDMMSGGIEYQCPLGKMVIDFADEPQFSKVAMYIKGRDWLDEKDKVVDLAGDCMPLTWHIKQGMWVRGSKPPSDADARRAPWFIKEANKNWGNAVMLCRKPSEVMGLTRPECDYVVQQHVPDPLLTDDGRKAHIKFYCLLICLEDGVTWQLYTYKEAYLSISPSKWSPDDISTDTQVTIVRHPVPVAQTDGWKQHWPDAYTKCKAGTASVVQKAVEGGKLTGRLGQKQFEVFSADWMMDTHGKAWLFEFNMSPALCQHEFAQSLDMAMLRDALTIVLPVKGQKKGVPGQWDLAMTFQGSSYVNAQVGLMPSKEEKMVVVHKTTTAASAS